MKNPKISVIISIYNGEKDLHIMLDSLLAQEFQEIEYILIDNGSTDKTAEVCKTYLEKDSRFRLETIKDNIGYIKARNFALPLAKGEYITFADADDFVSENAYKTMYDAVIKQNADMCIAPYNLVDTQGNIKLKPLGIPAGTYDKTKVLEVVKRIFGPGQNAPAINGFTWRMLYRRELIEKTNNTFFTEAKPKEDQIFNQVHALNCNCIEIIEYPVYNYIVNPDSVTAKLQSSFDYAYSIRRDLFLLDKSMENSKIYNVYDQVIQNIFSNLYEGIYFTLVNTSKAIRLSEVFRVSKELKQLLSVSAVFKMAEVLNPVKTARVDRMIIRSLKRNKYTLLLMIMTVSDKLHK